jgi:hypothetical protein
MPLDATTTSCPQAGRLNAKASRISASSSAMRTRLMIVPPIGLTSRGEEA